MPDPVLEKSEDKLKKTDRSTLDIDNSEIYHSSVLVDDESLYGNILGKCSQI